MAFDFTLEKGFDLALGNEDFPTYPDASDFARADKLIDCAAPNAVMVRGSEFVRCEQPLLFCGLLVHDIPSF